MIASLLAPSLLASSFDVPANVAFGIVAVMMIYCAIRVVTTSNVVHAALHLVVVLAGVGVNFLLLQAEFLAITQFLIYVGAVVVLFLFGIMLTRAEIGKVSGLDNSQRVVGVVVGLMLFVVVAYSLIRSFKGVHIDFSGSVTTDNTHAVSDEIFSNYLIPFEIASVMLLAALIGAIVLARKD